MNNDSLTLLTQLYENPYETQRTLAKQLTWSLGKVNSTLKQLKQEDYLDLSFSLTTKAYARLESHRPKQAIILAAGLGLRTLPLDDVLPKGLIELRQERLIERLIQQLLERDVRRIIVVVGHLKEKYEYLIDLFNVELVTNNHYSQRNNWYSLKLALSQTGTYVLPCDVWFKNNPFKHYETYSWYGVSSELSPHSYIRVSYKGGIELDESSEACPKMSGVAYFNQEDAAQLILNLNILEKKKTYWQNYWESALFDPIPLQIKARMFEADAFFEVNTYLDLKTYDASSSDLASPLIQTICSVFNVSEDQIQGIRVLKKGMTNRSVTFCVHGKTYVIRAPGRKTPQYIVRAREAKVLKIIKPYDISEEIVYYCTHTGVKISRFYSNARVCDINNPNDVKKTMVLLKSFHKLDLHVNHTFDFKDMLNLFERMRTQKKSLFEDYEKTKTNVLSLIDLVKSLPKETTLTHIDANPDNFLFIEDEVKLIDWEYAAMQDPHLDIAMFAVYADFDQKQTDQLMKDYFEEPVSQLIQHKIYAYMAISGFIWSNWAEYMISEGFHFGDYVFKQYRYAKTFFKLSYVTLKSMAEASNYDKN